MALPLDPFNAVHLWMPILIAVAIGVAGTLVLAILRFIRQGLYVRDLPGPVNSASWLYGNLPELLLSQPYGRFEYQWQEQYGPTYRFKGCFSENLLFISDSAAVRYILNDAKTFDLSPNRNFVVSMVFGKESMSSLRNGGEAHRRIKNAFSHAFAPARLQPYVPIISYVVHKAIDKLIQQWLEKSEQCNSHATVNIYQILQHVTSDIIGEVGFGHKFNAVETNGGDKVVQSHQNIIMLGSRRSKSAILGESVVPHLPRIILRSMLYLPTPTARTFRSFRKISEEWASALLRNSLLGENSGLFGFVTSTNNQKRGQLSFDEINRQTSLLLVAGQDTTANALSWALYELAKRPTWQDQIRKEIVETQNTETSLDKLEYLNAHIKETLRFHPGVPLTERMAFEDTVLPLSRPITTTSGRVITHLPVRKGQMIYVGLASYNRNPHIWGPDANTFDPLRWLVGRNDPGKFPASVGPYSNLASFGGGARVCLGWRLGVLAMQVVLSGLISKFRFRFTPEQEENITSWLALTLLPIEVGSEKPGLSLLIQPTQALES